MHPSHAYTHTHCFQQRLQQRHGVFDRHQQRDAV